MQSTQPANTQAVLAKLEVWKKQLLDLSRRNRLLYLTEAKAGRLVQITSPDLSELTDALVRRGRTLRFPLPLEEQRTIVSNSSAQTPGSESNYEVAVRKGDLETNTPVSELQRILHRLRRDWLTWKEEQGIHTIFLAVGLLRWKDSSYGEEEYYAPIILVPVSLERPSKDKPYGMTLVEEDIVINPALEFKLKTDFGITLPEFDIEAEEMAVEAYLREVARTVSKLGWQIMREVRLGRFTYEKFVMYNDLENHQQESSSHPIILALAKARPLSEGNGFEVPSMIDDVTNPAEIFPVLDADSSQTEVLLRARKEENLVIQGPPGTGKSQTIANLVAQGLRDGKRILFVSEKMAALEVVDHRLKQLGLSFACLEVHSHRSDKTRVIHELAKTLQLSVSTPSKSDAENETRRLITLRNQLNSYVRELHKPRGTLGLTAFEVYGRLSRVRNSPRLDCELPLQDPLTLTSESLDGLLDALGQLERIGKVFDNLVNHPWLGVELDTENDALSIAERIFDTVQKLSEYTDFLLTSIAPLTTLLLTDAISLEQVGHLPELIQTLARTTLWIEGWLECSEKALREFLDKARECREHSSNLVDLHKRLSRKFSPSLLGLPARELLTRFKTAYKTPLRFLKSEYRRDLSSLKQHWLPGNRLNYTEAAGGLETVSEILDEQSWFQAQDAELKRSFGNLYSGEITNWNRTVEALEQLIILRNRADLVSTQISLATILRQRAEVSEVAETSLPRMTEDFKRTSETSEKFSGILKGYQIEGGSIRHAPLPSLAGWLSAKRELQDLHDWIDYLRARKACLELGLDDFVTEAIRNNVKAEDLRRAFLRILWSKWLGKAHHQARILSEFSATTHEQIIQEFRSIDMKLKKTTIRLIQQKIAERQPKRTSSFSSDSQVGILLREAQKKRRLKPLRRLFADIPHLLQELKPCLLMSPLSVAGYLGTSPFRFDTVIFDEASQIPPADAIGAIVRGSQLIVAGDEKQLPPTTFFQTEIDFDEEVEEEIGEPLESILNEFLALPGFRRCFLKWHYRSKREELIDFSNKNFYEGDLVTFPSPDASHDPPAIVLYYVKDGVYDRGGSRKNRQEAREVVSLIEDHFRRYGSRVSLGVITLSIAQEEAIWEEWERKIMADQELATLSESNEDEPFFIKSLEKVQGDERDRIVMSLGYGRDPRGQISMYFGPINHAGGERRLNVAVTRAREKVAVVASIRSHEIDLARLTTGSRGVALLQKYLEYAENNGSFPAEIGGTSEPESDFELDVKEKLEARGHIVVPQVGCSGFRVDLAIRHPKRKNRYILGIECDGATYHSHRSARDRDRLRQEVLEKLGWRIQRIWAPDWVKNPDKVITKIDEEVRKLIQREDVGVSINVPVHPEEPPQVVDHAVITETTQANGVIETEDRPASGGLHNIPSEFKVYEQFETAVKKRPESLYLAGSDLYYEHHRSELAKYIEAIVEKESPVHMDAVSRRVATIYGISKAGSRVKTIVSKAARWAASRKRLQVREDFLWSNHSQSPVPRVGANGEAVRPIDEVSIEELMNAAEIIVKRELGIMRDALVRSVARALGYNRIGHKVEQRVERALNVLIRDKRVNLYRDQIVPLPDDFVE